MRSSSAFDNDSERVGKPPVTSRGDFYGSPRRVRDDPAVGDQGAGQGGSEVPGKVRAPFSPIDAEAHERTPAAKSVAPGDIDSKPFEYRVGIGAELVGAVLHRSSGRKGQPGLSSCFAAVVGERSMDEELVGDSYPEDASEMVITRACPAELVRCGISRMRCATQRIRRTADESFFFARHGPSMRKGLQQRKPPHGQVISAPLRTCLGRRPGSGDVDSAEVARQRRCG